jgi:hypothetical protein
VPKWVRNSLTSPRTWLATGAFCIGSSFVVGYYADQQNAYQALYQKVGTPKEVFIQDFVPEKHMNIINHVNVLGEMDARTSVTINLGSADEPRMILVVPIFPVGSEMMPYALQDITRKTGVERRPVPRAEAAALAERQGGIDALQGHAFALVVKTLADAQDGSRVLGESDFEVLAEYEARQLVRLSGAIVSGRSLQVRLSDGLLQAGIPSTPDTLMIEPPSQLSVELVSEGALARARTWLVSFGILFALLGAAMPLIVTAAPRKTQRVPATESVAASNAFPAVRFFQPIATQDELFQEEDARLEQDNAKTAPVLAITALIDRVQTAMRIRSLR